jgi:hypothetical protein
MKRLVVLAMGVCFILCCHPAANAAWFGKKKQSTEGQPAAQQDGGVVPAQQPKVEAAKEQPKAAVTKEDKAKREAIAAKKLLEERKRKELANTEWQIELVPLSGKGKKEAETVIFKDNHVSFSAYGKKGFPATNFTLSVQDDGLVVWETMQTSEKAGVMFWRGEMPDMQTLRGIFSYHPDEKTTIDYSFTSTGKKGS